MATFLINTAGVSQEGTPQDDFFIVESGAFGDTLFGAEANDSFDFTNFTTGVTYGNGIAGGNEGQDTIDILATAGNSFLGNYFGGGKGSDSISVAFNSADKWIGNTVQGGAGNDTIVFSAGTANELVNSTVNGNAGNDLIDISGVQVSGSINGFFVGGGADTDVINVNLSSDSGGVFQSLFLNGGLGTDVITLEYSRTADGLNINGGTFNTLDSEDGSDNIFVSADNLDNSTIAGNNGDDIIDVYAGSNTSEGVLIAGNAGDDTIRVSGNEFEATTIGGGAGNDLIEIESADTFSAGGSSVFGGTGNDTILADDGSDFSASDGVTFEGGAGADLFTTTAALASANSAEGFGGGQFSYASLSDSTFGAADTIVVGSGASGTYVMTMPSNVDVFNGQLGSTNLFFSGGVLQHDTGTFSSNPLNLGQMVAVLDANLAEGEAVAFRLQTGSLSASGGEGYVFVKGTSDDLLVEFGSVQTGFSAGSTTLTNSAPDAISLNI
jgi:hypothetical protein